MIVEISPSRALIQAGWDDVPHLDDETKRELRDSTPPHLRDARMKGIPSLGAGAIYPIQVEDIMVPYMPIPPFWPRAYALDVGWKRTAGVWGAWDPETGILYLYAEHYRGMAEPSIHADSIKARGKWIRGTADPAARASSQDDGKKLLDIYRNLELDLSLADNAVDAGIYDVWAGLSNGRIKVMSHLQNWFAEYRIYRRDENGKIVKSNDHLMDATRYLVRSGRGVARVKPAPPQQSFAGSSGDARMGY